MKQKKAVMSEVISVFVLILIVSILAGLTFLFVSELKDQAATTAATTWTKSSETSNGVRNAGLNATGYKLNAAANDALSSGWTITGIWNDTVTYGLTNATVNASGWLFNVSTFTFSDSSFKVNYTYTSAAGTPAYSAINDTESSGATVVDYLPLIFLALIFGVILTLVLKIILPYINLGKEFGQF